MVIAALSVCMARQRTLRRGFGILHGAVIGNRGYLNQAHCPRRALPAPRTAPRRQTEATAGNGRQRFLRTGNRSESTGSTLNPSVTNRS
ncbi:hypothetical protein GCM10018773_47130 [Streptomyces candidus]|nr:hypothetical protein GCM10018773_47130 [Streptomyces candidus]